MALDITFQDDTSQDPNLTSSGNTTATYSPGGDPVRLPTVVAIAETSNVDVTISTMEGKGNITITMPPATVTGSGTSITISGNLTDVNNTLNKVDYAPDVGDDGVITFTYNITDDQGRTGKFCSDNIINLVREGVTSPGMAACTGEIELTGTNGTIQFHILDENALEVTDLTIPLPFNTSLSQTVNDIITNINVNTTTPNFTAMTGTAPNTFVVCATIASGATPNGWGVYTEATTGDLQASTPNDVNIFSGGIDPVLETKKLDPELGDILLGAGSLLVSALANEIAQPNQPKTRIELPQEDGVPVRDVRYYYQGNSQVPVPDVYDEVNRVMTGPWDYTTFKFVFTDNPAWCALEHIQDTEWGLGQRVYALMNDAQKIQLHTDLFNISQRCDETVNGGTRYTINALLTSNRTPLEQLEDICSVFHGRPVWEPRNILRINQDTPKVEKLIVNYTSVTEVGFEYNTSNSNTISDTSYVNWYDPDKWSSKTTETVMLTIDNAFPDPAQRPIDAWGSDNREQAIRHGRKVILDDATVLRTVNYTSTLDHSDIIPGDFVRILDPFDPANNANNESGFIKQGRILSQVSTTEFVIDSRPTSTHIQTNDAVYLTLEDGTVHSSTITGINGFNNQITIADAIPQPLAPLAKYNITDGRIFMVTKITPRLPAGYQVVGIEYNPDKWTIIDGSI